MFTGITVDPTTGQVNLRAEVPNPDNVLLPGMYVRVKLEQGVDDKALLVPQQALQRTPDGAQSLMLVNKENKVEQVPVTTGGAVKTNWIVTSGLKAGDTVVVEGFRRSAPARRCRPARRRPAGRRARRPACCAAAGQAGRGRARQAGACQQDPAAGQKSKRLAAPIRRRVPSVSIAFRVRPHAAILY